MILHLACGQQPGTSSIPGAVTPLLCCPMAKFSSLKVSIPEALSSTIRPPAVRLIFLLLATHFMTTPRPYCPTAESLSPADKEPADRSPPRLYMNPPPEIFLPAPLYRSRATITQRLFCRTVK